MTKTSGFPIDNLDFQFSISSSKFLPVCSKAKKNVLRSYKNIPKMSKMSQNCNGKWVQWASQIGPSYCGCRAKFRLPPSICLFVMPIALTS